MLDFVVIASTNGGVLGRLLESEYFRSRIRCVVSDRKCGAIEIALRFDVPVKVFETKNGLDFSNFLLDEFLTNSPDLFVSFYTRLFRGNFLSFAKTRLVNLHPSILPACPGQDGFGDTVKSGAKFIGATVHFVDEGMDTGYPIMQSAMPFNPNQTIEMSRHLVFIQQCKMLLQVLKWAEDDRIRFDDRGKPLILNASYIIGEFSPNLDFDDALELNVALPDVR